MSATEYPETKGLFNNPAYSHVAVTSGTRTIYLAGQVAADETGATVGVGDLAAQAEQVMRNIGVALAAAGASFADVVKLTTYVVDYTPEKRAAVSKARTVRFEGRPPPASTLVGVQALANPEWLVEIEAIAVLK